MALAVGKLTTGTPKFRASGFVGVHVKPITAQEKFNFPRANAILPRHRHYSGYEIDIGQEPIGQLRIVAFFMVFQPFSDVLSISNIRQTIWQNNENNFWTLIQFFLSVLFKVIKARENLSSRNLFVCNSLEVSNIFFFVKIRSNFL
jgi:hypothetical protein